MKNAKKYLVVSIVTLVFAVVIATSSTFAWFAMTDTPAVNNFDLTVTSYDNLYISSQAEAGFAFTMTTTPEGTERLDSVTPELAGTNIASTFQLKKLDGTTNATVGSYYTFNVYFLSTQEYTVYLNAAAITTSDVSDAIAKSPVAVTAASTADYPAALAVGDDFDAKAGDAMRIAVKGTTGDGLGSFYYNPNSGKGWDNYTAVEAEGDFPAYKMAHAYFNANYKSANRNDNLNTTQVTESADVKTAIIPAGEANSVPLTKLTAASVPASLTNYFGQDVPAYYGSVTVYVWLEGKDADCVADAIYEDVVSTNLSFKGITVVGG